MKTDWKRKLSSRKFWVAVANFVAQMVVFIGYSEDTATKITALIMSGAGVIAFIIAEGLADSNSVNVVGVLPDGEKEE